MSETVRCLVAPSIKKELDDVCTLERVKGNHYGATFAALLVLGLRQYRKSQVIYPSVIREALNG